MGKKFLIDSNVLLEYVGDVLPENIKHKISQIISEDFNVSIINYIEILGHSSADKQLEDFLELASIHDLTKEIVKQTIEIRKTCKIKLPDAIIAATAIVNTLTLVSRNSKDFNRIKNLSFIDPYEMPLVG